MSDMNLLSALIKFAAIGLLAVLLAGAGPDFGNDVFPLAGLLVFIIGTLVLCELTIWNPAPSVSVEQPMPRAGDTEKGVLS